MPSLKNGPFVLSLSKDEQKHQRFRVFVVRQAHHERFFNALLELLEPVLFFGMDPRGAELFADALVKRLE